MDAAATPSERTEALLRSAAAFEADADVPAGLAHRALARQIAQQEARERDTAGTPQRRAAGGSAWLNGLSLGTLAGAVTVAAAVLLLHPSDVAPLRTVPPDAREVQTATRRAQPAADMAEPLPPGTFLPWQEMRSHPGGASAAAADVPEVRQAAATNTPADTAAAPTAPHVRHGANRRTEQESAPASVSRRIASEAAATIPERSVSHSHTGAPEPRRAAAEPARERPLAATLHTETVDRSAYQLVAAGYVATAVESASGAPTEAVMTPVSLQADLVPASVSSGSDASADGAPAPAGMPTTDPH